MNKNQEEEIKRLQRIRDEQLQNRNPHAKRTANYQRAVAKYQKRQKKTTVMDLINDLPAKFWYMIIGGLLGAAVTLALFIFLQEPWIKTAGWFIILFGLISGRVIGAARDWGDEDWD